MDIVVGMVRYVEIKHVADRGDVEPERTRDGRQFGSPRCRQIGDTDPRVADLDGAEPFGRDVVQLLAPEERIGGCGGAAVRVRCSQSEDTARKLPGGRSRFHVITSS